MTIPLFVFAFLLFVTDYKFVMNLVGHLLRFSSRCIPELLAVFSNLTRSVVHPVLQWAVPSHDRLYQLPDTQDIIIGYESSICLTSPHIVLASHQFKIQTLEHAHPPVLVRNI